MRKIVSLSIHQEETDLSDCCAGGCFYVLKNIDSITNFIKENLAKDSLEIPLTSDQKRLIRKLQNKYSEFVSENQPTLFNAVTKLLSNQSLETSGKRDTDKTKHTYHQITFKLNNSKEAPDETHHYLELSIAGSIRFINLTYQKIESYDNISFNNKLNKYNLISRDCVYIIKTYHTQPV